MSDRTTVPVTKDRREETSEIKDEYGETWNDVLAFYLHFRDEFPEKPRFCEDVYVGDIPDQGDVCNGDIDADEIARKVAERLEGSKPLEEMAFEDWFEPDYAKTIANHFESEIMLSEVGVDYTPVLNRLDDLESRIPKRTAEELR